MSSKFLEIRPNNVPSARNGGISHRNGLPVISFTIGSQNALLDMSSIRLVGDLNFWINSEGTTRPTSGNASSLTASHKLGVYGAIEQLTWRNSKTKQITESIRSYGRFMSSFLPVMSSREDAIGHLSESALVHNSSDSFKTNVIRSDRANSFCIPLPCGMTLGGEPLELFENSFGGIECEISLVPDSQFFYSDDADTSRSYIQNAFYEFTNLKIVCEVHMPPPDQLSQMMARTEGTYTFNSIVSLYSTIQSSNAIISYNLGLSNVISAFINFVPSSFINNLAQDGYLTYYPSFKTAGTIGSVDQVIFLKNGERHPYHFDINSNTKNQSGVTVADPQIQKTFLSSIMPESDHVRSNVSPATSNRNFVVSSANNSYGNMPNMGASIGVGVLYDMLDSSGENFKNEQFGVQMITTVTDANPTSAYLFVKSRQTMLFNAQGIQIIQ